jgi:hypothetical protein
MAAAVFMIIFWLGFERFKTPVPKWELQQRYRPWVKRR